MEALRSTGPARLAPFALAMVAAVAPAPAIGLQSPVAVAIASTDVAGLSRQEAPAPTMAAAPVKGDARDTRAPAEAVDAPPGTQGAPSRDTRCRRAHRQP